MSVQQIIVFITAFFLALMAGVFYAYSCSVNPGLNKLQASDYLRTMQVINRAILNPFFLLPFVTTVVLLPLSAWLAYHGGMSVQFYLFLAAALVYAFGAFGVTIMGNVPLNEMLDKADLTSVDVEQLRVSFEIPWNKLHTIRTVSIVVSLGLVLVGLVKRET
jgi:uncharacterized membrane protein